MQITIQKTEQGECQILIDGKNAVWSTASGELTGSTHDDGGIFSFNSKINIRFGKYEKNFDVNVFDFSNPKNVEKEIRARVRNIRNWIKECKAQAYEHIFSIS